MGSSKYCSLQSQTSALSSANDADDCLKNHESGITKFIEDMPRQFENLLLHLKATRKLCEEKSKACNRFERKYSEAKTKINELEAQLETAKKLKSSRSNQPAKIASNVLNTAADNNIESDASIDLVFKPSKLKPGKENSPKKRTKSSLSNQWLKKASVTSTKSLVNSSPKLLKQPKISFNYRPAETKVKSELLKETKVVDFNETPSGLYNSEDLKKVVESFCFTEKSKTSKPNLDKSLTIKRKLPRRNSVDRSATTSKLFDFKQQQTSETAIKPASPSHDETVDFSFLKGIKQEPHSQSNVLGSDLDIFQDEGSEGSVYFGEPIDNGPILIEDTIPEDQTLLEELKKPATVNPYLVDSIEPSPKIVEPTRKRRRVYGECDDCREFYDRYAELNGPTQADEYFRNCPNKCKGFRVREERAAPPLPLIQYKPRKHPDDTPYGFWDIPFTPEQTEDSDKTLDGLSARLN